MTDIIVTGMPRHGSWYARLIIFHINRGPGLINIYIEG